MPKEIRRSNTGPGQFPVEDMLEYYDDKVNWVLSQPRRTVRRNDGAIVEERTYDGTTGLLAARYAFGLKEASYQYDSRGALAAFADPAGNTTRLREYRRGIPTRIEYPDGAVVTATVDDQGQLTSRTNAVGHTTRFSYDSMGRLSRVDYPLDGSGGAAPKIYEYGLIGAQLGINGAHWRERLSWGTSVQETHFDALFRPVLETRYEAGVSRNTRTRGFSYDYRGSRVFESIWTAGSRSLADLSIGTRTSFDIAGRLRRTVRDSELGAVAEEVAYPSGVQVRSIDANGAQTTTTFQATDGPRYDLPIRVDAPEGVTKIIARDVHGFMTSTRQYGREADSTTQVFYDPHHRVCRTTAPETANSFQAYDTAGKVSWIARGIEGSLSGCAYESVPSSLRTTNTYDAGGRLKEVRHPGESIVNTFTYDANGALTKSVSGNIDRSYVRNSLGMVSRETMSVDGLSWVSVYGYGPRGDLRWLQHPSGRRVAYSPDGWGWPSKASYYAGDASYFANGGLEGLRLNNGTELQLRQNAREAVSAMTYARAGSLLVADDLRYDRAGNLVEVVDVSDAGQRSRSLRYDGLRRLIAASGPAFPASETYRYDALSNLRVSTGTLGTRQFEYDPMNRLARVKRDGGVMAQYAYDQRGNLSNRNGEPFIFDGADRLTRIGAATAHRYDALGRRAHRRSPSGESYEFYDHAGTLLTTLQPGTGGEFQATDYIRMSGRLLAKHKATLLPYKPNAPSSVILKDHGEGKLSVSWAESEGATRHELMLTSDRGCALDVDEERPGFASQTVSRNGLYQFNISACNHLGCSDRTASNAAQIYIRPREAPALSVPATTATGSFRASWTEVINATEYRLYEKYGDGQWNRVWVGEASSSDVVNQRNGENFYAVEACNPAGCGPRSVQARIWVGIPPPAPSNVRALERFIGTKYATLTITWNPSAGSTRYEIRKQLGNNDVYSGLETSVLVERVEFGQPFADGYNVRACNEYACSIYVNAGIPLPGTPAVAPSISAPGWAGDGNFDVVISRVARADRYEIDEQVNGGPWQLVQAGPQGSYAARAKPVATYGYRARACSASGCSPSSSVHVVVVLPPPPVPASVLLTERFIGAKYQTLTVTWIGSSAASRYEIVKAGLNEVVYSGLQTSVLVERTDFGFPSTSAFFVRACHNYGCSSLVSAGASIPGGPATAPVINGPPGSVDGNYDLSWSPALRATRYVLYENVNGGGWTPVYDGAGRSHALRGRGQANYGYYAVACNATGCGPASAVHGVIVSNAPPPPTNISVIPFMPNPKRSGEKASWSASPRATYYEARRRDTGAHAYRGAETTFVICTGSAELGCPAGTFFWPSVRACNASGCSDWADR